MLDYARQPDRNRKIHYEGHGAEMFVRAVVTVLITGTLIILTSQVILWLFR
jgi:hypothetical protein